METAEVPRLTGDVVEDDRSRPTPAVPDSATGGALDARPPQVDLLDMVKGNRRLA
jgi:hypothetical protein